MRRPWALPLVPLYAAAIATKNSLYKANILRPKTLTRPVVSVGSLSAGGAGKTPVVLMLADLLQRHGLPADVLSRGYGRGSGVVEEADPLGTAQRFGDEPLELARRGLRVFVGADRYAAGVFAEALYPPDLHLLDDGFQHRRLARQLDIVLLTAEDVRDHLLPAGNLREPVRSLRRADVVVLREEEAAQLLPGVTARTAAEVWTVRRELLLPPVPPGNPIAFCALARPESFFAMLRDQGCHLTGQIAFVDHHPYSAADIESLLNAAQHAHADGFIVTAKDAVKLSGAALARLGAAGPVVTAQLTVSLHDEALALKTIRRACALA